MIGLLFALIQAPAPPAGDGWAVTPSRVTVGDTIRVERTVAAPPGWRIRAGRLSSGSVAEPLSDAVVLATPTPGQWVVRYAIVAWAPGPASVEMPAVWRLGPDGSVDSIPGGNATFRVASVIPDSVKSPGPQPAVAPLRLDRSSPIPVIAAVLLAGGLLALLVAWKRRGPRVVAVGAGVAHDTEVPDARWLAAGEPKAVAARAAQRLRFAVANAIPEAHTALSTEECLTAVERARPNAPLRDLRELLLALDQVAFATAHGVEIAPLAARARALARELGNGAKR